MQATRRRDTKPELLLRKRLHAMGLRYRIDRSPLRGVRRRADLVFTTARVAVFVDGCFWHSCPIHGTMPKKNREFWKQKLATNQARDRDTDERLRKAGWEVVRVWEHEDPDEGAERVAEVLRERSSRG